MDSTATHPRQTEGPGDRSSANAWVLSRANHDEARLRLFCLPHAGSGASAFALWAHAMPAGVDVCPIQLPGRENRFREAPFTVMADLIQALAAGLAPLLDRRFALFGHSMGAVIAYELALYLRRDAHVAPTHIFVSGRRAPHVSEYQPPIHRLPDPTFLLELQRRYGRLPEVILRNRELLDLFLPTIRADLTLIETHACSHGEPLTCPISAYGGENDPLATPELLAPWRQCTTGIFRQKTFPGNHYYLQSSRLLLLEEIRKELVASRRPAEGCFP